RIVRTLRRLGIRSVAVYSDADAGALHVRSADAAERIGESPAPASYLNPAAMVEAALRSGAEAVHPGYGFLSESPKFARAVLGARFFDGPAGFVERDVGRARHVEVQVLFGAYGRGIHRYERDCSVQRRHQKVIEETPSPALDRELRLRMCRSAVSSMDAIGYR